MKKIENLFAIILTKNEGIHIKRCLRNVKQLTENIIVIDSFSTDTTVEVAEELGAKVIQRPWVNYADQFSFGQTLIDRPDAWVLRIDADEYMTQSLIDEIRYFLNSDMINYYDGIVLKRRMFFLRKKIRFGGVFPIQVLRIFKNEKGRIENRWMDEHITLTTKRSILMNSELIDDNKNNLSWWIEKHNRYASREALDILNRKYALFRVDSDEELFSSEASTKRFVKQRIYNRMPLFLRPLLYFVYRYIFRFGFLDGVTGFEFHFFQGLWYRALVDAKVLECEKLYTENKSWKPIFENVLEIKVKLDDKR